MVVTVLLCSFTLLPNKVVGQCEWTGWGTCHPSILLGLLDPVSALQYEAIMMDVNLGEAERKTLVMQWAQNQDPLVWVCIV
ncbi:unnamed protein product [Anisakis simplex]|uniref:Secreted protein n=1 Tax=Anisakis simplex TaxID=6269 RepID=A0A0M3JWH6_ANISI|nr:unnamed protein product [Anisakis simplex]